MSDQHTNFMPPRCEKHNEQMVLYFCTPPNSPMGNGWSCRSCINDREQERLGQTTRFPEGAEL